MPGGGGIMIPAEENSMSESKRILGLFTAFEDDVS
jgi:hypothetical protein